MTPDAELHLLRTGNATLRHSLEHLGECLAAIDAFTDAAAVALGELIREFEGEPEVQARVSAALPFWPALEQRKRQCYPQGRSADLQRGSAKGQKLGDLQHTCPKPTTRMQPLDPPFTRLAVLSVASVE
jgi:hypothetical protein